MKLELRSRVQLITLLTSLAVFAGESAAQTATGNASPARLAGQVFSASTGDPVPGARVEIEGTNVGTLAGIEGRYQIVGVPVGPVTVRVSMLGHAPKVITGMEAVAGETLRLDITIESQALTMEAISVTVQQERGSMASLLDGQRLASAVVNGISSEQISRSPDGDAASAVRRVSGVTVQDGRSVFVRGLGERYTTSSLNGARIPSPDPEKKTVPLDLFPTGLLQSVSTVKTFTPDRPGDFSGGAVDIRTPEFPTVRTVTFSMSTGYSPDVTGQSILAGPRESGEWFAFGASDREIPSAARDFSGSVTRGEEVNDVVNSFRNVWTVREDEGRLPLSLSSSVSGSTEVGDRRLGYLAGLSYSNSQEVRLEQVRAKYGVGNVERDRYEGEEGTTSVLWGGLANVSLLLGTHSQVHFNNTFSRSADNTARRESGVDENTQSTVRVDRLTYVERSVRSHQLLGQHQLGERNRLDWNLNASFVSRSEPDRSEFVTWLDPATPIWFKDYEGAVRTFGLVDEMGLEGGTSYALDFGSDRVSPNRIKVGANVRRVERDAESVGFRIQPFYWTPDDPRWQSAPEEFFDGRYTGEGDDLLTLATETAGGSYTARDWLVAGFAMTEIDLTDRVRMIAGARVESYQLLLSSENQLGQEFSTKKEYVDLLPSLTTNVALWENHQLRLSAARTLARPEYREVAPITYREVLGGDQVIGNLNLERTLIDNFDARWEWYPNAGEVLSIGVFAKFFDSPIEQRYIGSSGTDILSFANAESATNYGVELDMTRKLGGISPILEPWSLFGNVTLMRSRVAGDEGTADRAMVAQAPWVVNSGIAYAGESGVAANLLYNVVGPRIANARSAGVDTEDVVEQPRHVLDLSLRFPLMGNGSAKADFRNLLDSPYELIQGTVIRERYRTGRSISVGLSWRW